MRFTVYKTLGLVAMALVVVLAAQSCSNGPGTGTLALSMGYGNGFAAAPSPIATQSEDFGSGDRTPLSDLILSFNSVRAWSCADNDSLEDHDDDDDSTHTDDAALIRPLHDGGDEGDDEDCSSFVVLADSTVTLSTGTLDSTLTGFVGKAQLPEGSYDFLTLENAQAWVVTAAGDTVKAKVPSGRIRIKAPFTITDGGITDLLVVFDLNRSIVEAPPGSLNFIVKPVCHSQVGWDHEGEHDGD